jgi:hypothetical protein
MVSWRFWARVRVGSSSDSMGICTSAIGGKDWGVIGG